MPKKAPTKRVWTDEQKGEAARKRSQHVAIRNYLDALGSANGNRAKDPAKLELRLKEIEAQLPDARPIDRLKLLQEQMDLTVALNATDHSVDGFVELEAAFIEQAWEWAQRNGISYKAFRELGVPASTLRDAGISRSA